MGQAMSAPKRGRGRPRKDASDKPVASLAAKSKASEVKDGVRRLLRSDSSERISATPVIAKRGRRTPPKKHNAKISKDKVTKNASAEAKEAIKAYKRGGHMKAMQDFCKYHGRVTDTQALVNTNRPVSAHRHEVEEHKFKRQQKLLGKMVSKPKISYPQKYLASSLSLFKHSVRTMTQGRKQVRGLERMQKKTPEHLLEKAKSTADRCAQWKESVEKAQSTKA